MEIAFSDAKNGETTCALGGKHFHSAYNPSREAEQFVARLSVPFNPSAVVIIEPALSYCASFLRKRFPHAMLCAVRTCTFFSASDEAWDAVFASCATLSEQLFSKLGEETLCSALFFAWQPSEQLFPEASGQAWRAIKAAVLKSRDVLATRSYFAKRWMKNAVRFCARLRHPALLRRGTGDILIAASGPSLRSSLPHIAAHRTRFFLIALSSALLPLLHEGVTPDLVLSTDGGFWAKRHLECCGYDITHIPFALAAESACPTVLLETQTVVPLCYSDGIEAPLLSACGLPAMGAVRNGTVSGTAVEFALTLTSGNIYLCGLDLATAPGFQHTQPNALELRNEAHDARLHPKHTRIAAAAFGAHGSLAIYRDWFISASERLAQRVFRLSDSYPFVHSLGKIQDIDWTAFAQNTARSGRLFPVIEPTEMTLPDPKHAIATLLPNVFATNAYDSELCPVETLMQKRAATESERHAYAKDIAQKKTQFLRELQGLL